MKIQHLTVFVCLFCIGLASCSHAQNQKKEAKKFRLPDVPVTLTAPEDRADYLSLHYWDHFDFADTSLISRPEITEQAFVDFISVLPYSSKAQTAVDTLFCRALVSNEMLYHSSPWVTNICSSPIRPCTTRSCISSSCVRWWTIQIWESWTRCALAISWKWH